VIIDASALVAILKAEPEQETFVQIIARAGHCRISAATYLETAIVIDRARDPVASRKLDSFLVANNIAIAEVTAEQARIARQAYRDFGRGSGHPAQLNFGDCLTYALAKETGEPILFKGDDFSHTDLDRADRQASSRSDNPH
jgi:ribonuclease VapC